MVVWAALQVHLVRGGTGSESWSPRLTARLRLRSPLVEVNGRRKLIFRFEKGLAPLLLLLSAA